MKVFSTKWSLYLLISESFLPWKFPTIRYQYGTNLHLASESRGKKGENFLQAKISAILWCYLIVRRSVNLVWSRTSHKDFAYSSEEKGDSAMEYLEMLCIYVITDIWLMCTSIYKDDRSELERGPTPWLANKCTSIPQIYRMCYIYNDLVFSLHAWNSIIAMKLLWPYSNEYNIIPS